MRHLHRLENNRVELSGSFLLLRHARLHVAVTARELLDPARGIDEFLLTSEKRVARGANTDLQPLPRRTRVVGRATGAGDGRFFILGMNVGFHGLNLGAGKVAVPRDPAIKKNSSSPL